MRVTSYQMSTFLVPYAVAAYLKAAIKPRAEEEMSTTKLTANARVLTLLSHSQVVFTQKTHVATVTSLESAQVRGETLESGAKAMILSTNKPHNRIIMCVLSAAKTISFPKLKRHLQVSDISLTSPDLVYEITNGCLPGAVPPFGSIFQIQTLLDPSLVEQGEVMNFNAGLRTESIRMNVNDYLKVEKPEVCEFSK